MALTVHLVCMAIRKLRRLAYEGLLGPGKRLTEDVGLVDHLLAVLIRCSTTGGLTESGFQIQTFRVWSIRRDFSCGSRAAAKNFALVFLPTNEPFRSAELAANYNASGRFLASLSGES